MIRCPVHADRHASCGTKRRDDGDWDIFCHACGKEATPDIREALGLPRERTRKPDKPAKRREWPYHNADGSLAFTVIKTADKRFWMRGPRGEKSIKGIRRVPYRLPDCVDACRRGKALFIPEGEKDADNLAALGLNATTNPGGAVKWRASYTDDLADAPRVFIIADNDEPGRKHTEQVRASFASRGIPAFIIELPNLPPKGDVSDWLAAGGTREQLEALCREAIDKPAPPAPTDGPVTPTYVDEIERAKSMLTDLHAAQRLAEGQGERILHHPAFGFLHFDGRRWAMSRAAVERLAHKVGQTYRQDAARQTLEVMAREYFKHAKKLESAKGIEAVLAILKSLKGIDATGLEFDTDPWSLNALNGTIDLRTEVLRPHRREDLITKLCQLEYHPDAKCPTWLAHLDRVFAGDKELIEYLQVAVGYTASGYTGWQCFFICHGPRATGKTTTINTIERVLGDDYSKALDPEALLVQKHARHSCDIAAINGVRCVTSLEFGEGRHINEPLVKTLTGGEKISARFMRRDPFDFVPQCKLWLGTNHAPVARDDSGGFFRRVRLIPFVVDLLNAHRDPNIGEKLAAESEGILAWIVRGAMRAAQGEPELPKAVKVATAEYESESDVLAAFIAETCELDRHAEVSKAALYAAYQGWLGGAGRGMGKGTFGKKIAARGFDEYRGRTGRAWLGIRLQP